MNFDMTKLMQQAQKMQEQMKDVEKNKENAEVTGESGAGLVKVTMTGKYDVKRVNIDKSLLKEDDIEILEDLIAAATNSAVKKVEELSVDLGKMAKDAGINLPDGMKFPF